MIPERYASYVYAPFRIVFGLMRGDVDFATRRE